MDNLEIYSEVANVPENAQKTITAGRIKGMTDINPMWRIMTLTKVFGVVGFGWKYVITDKRIIEGADGVQCAFVDIDLFVRNKESGEWSDAIQGTGGSSFVSSEKNGFYTSDECFKMALTDALSVACKALGIGADVYWAAGRTKYETGTDDTPKAQNKPVAKPAAKEKTPREQLIAKLKEKGIDSKVYAQEKGIDKNTTPERFAELLAELG